MDRGISFSLGGVKRPAAGRGGKALDLGKAKKKKPSVVDVFAEDSEEEAEEQDSGGEAKREGHSEISVAAAVCPPDDPTIRHVAERLAEFVAKNGRNYEEVTRQRNPGETPFKFLFHRSSHEYLYYEAKLKEFQAFPGTTQAFAPPLPTEPPPPPPPPQPPSAPYEHAPPPPPVMLPPALSSTPESEPKPRSRFSARTSAEDPKVAAKAALAAGDSIAAMNAYMKLAAKQEELRPKQTAAPPVVPDPPKAPPPPPRPPSPPGSADEDSSTSKKTELLNDTAFERRRTYAVYKDDGSRGHHMQDFIPPSELAKFMAKCQDDASQTHAKILEEQAKIGADNIGHKLLSRMGWKEGEGLGAQGKGIAKPVEAGSVKSDNLGLGAISVGDVTSEDDVYEQYRKRMMLGYKFRPNPLGNPRRAYY